MKYDILIIGAGPAGMWATVYGILHNKKICIIESSQYIGGQPSTLYSEKTIYDIPAHIKIRAGEYAQSLINQFKHYKDEYTFFNETRLESWVHNDDTNTFLCILSNKIEIETKYIIFATGLGEFRPRKLIDTPLEFQKKRIHYLIQNLSKFENKKIVIFGGGDSAVDWANIIVEDDISKQVSIVHHSNKYRAMQKSVSRLNENDIKQYLNYSLEKMEEDIVILNHNETNEKIILNYDEIICMYGIEPNRSDHFNHEIFEMKANKFITNRSQETNIKNIYAIGQACIYDNRPNLIIVAQAEATIAIKAIMAKEKISN